jgi:hypothetical protein
MHVTSVFTDAPHRHALINASQSDLAQIVGAILDIRAHWSAHTSSAELQYDIERALNLVKAPEILPAEASPSNGPDAENRFRQQRENNGLYVIKAWLETREPSDGWPSVFEPLNINDGVLFEDDPTKRDCTTCDGFGEHSCRECQAEHECGDCGGSGRQEGADSEERHDLPIRYALRRRGSDYVVMYEEERSAYAAMAVMKEFPPETLDNWFAQTYRRAQQTA